MCALQLTLQTDGGIVLSENGVALRTYSLDALRLLLGTYLTVFGEGHTDPPVAVDYHFECRTMAAWGTNPPPQFDAELCAFWTPGRRHQLYEEAQRLNLFPLILESPSIAAVDPAETLAAIVAASTPAQEHADLAAWLHLDAVLTECDLSDPADRVAVLAALDAACSRENHCRVRCIVWNRHGVPPMATTVADDGTVTHAENRITCPLCPYYDTCKPGGVHYLYQIELRAALNNPGATAESLSELRGRILAAAPLRADIVARHWPQEAGQ